MKRLIWLSCAVVTAISLSACGDKNLNNITNVVTPPNNGFTRTLLVSDIASGAATVDTLLVNPWGLGFSPTGVLWVANNGTGTSTLYNPDGTKAGGITIPGATAGSTGKPTGLILNSTTDFAIGTSGPALYVFAGEDGSISAWNPNLVDAVLVADRSASGAVYKGIAIAQNGGVNALYATDFKNNAIDVYDGSFAYVRSFTDPNIPAGYAPFGIQAINGLLYVTYAKQLAPDNEDDEAGVGLGYVDVFNADGSVSQRFVSNGGLNAPWAVAMAPSGFGVFGGKLLIGNFGDGQIGAYEPSTGAFIDWLRDGNGNIIAIDGLWGLAFGPSSASTTLYFAAGPASETHGAVGTLTPR